MAPKKRAKMESSAIATRSGKVKLVSDPLPPKSKKAKTITSGNSGASSSASAIVTRVSTRRGKAKLNSSPAETQQPKSKKRENPKPSANLTDRDKGKAKLESELPSVDTPDPDLSMTLAKLTIAENRALFSPAPKKMANVKPSSILTRSAKGKAEMESSTTVTTRSSARRAKGKAKMESPPKSKKRANVQTSTISTGGAKGKAKEEEPPKSKKAKTAIFDGSTSSSTISTRRGKAKLGSDSTAVNPLPPKPKKASGGYSSLRIRANVEASSTRMTRSSAKNL